MFHLRDYQRPTEEYLANRAFAPSQHIYSKAQKYWDFGFGRCYHLKMRCSPDLRKRVIEFVKGGGSKVEAARRFQVSRASVYRWVGAPDGLSFRRPGPKGPRRLDWQALRRQVEEHSDMTQKERARYFGVSRHCIWHALQK